MHVYTERKADSRTLQLIINFACAVIHHINIDEIKGSSQIQFEIYK